jgi:hypothetical protein
MSDSTNSSGPTNDDVSNTDQTNTDLINTDEPSTNDAKANSEAAAAEQADYESRPDVDETMRDGLDPATKDEVAAAGLTEGL